MPVRYQFRERMTSPELLDYCAQLHHLSLGERNILADLFRGETLKEIAHKKGLSIKTISAHKRRAFTKMQVNSDVNYIHYMYFLKEQRALLTRENLLSSFSGPSG